jgi:hypothetical protein
MRLINMETSEKRTHDTAHLAIPAFKPTTMINVLALPRSAYHKAKTEAVPDVPNARKIVFTKFTLSKDIPKISALIKQNTYYKDYDIDIKFTSWKSLEVTVSRLNQALDIQQSSKKSITNDTELEFLNHIVKTVIGGTIPTDYSSFRSKSTHDGYAFFFSEWKHGAVDEASIKNLEIRCSNFNIIPIINNDGLYLSFVKKDANSPVQYALKELPTVETVEETVATVTKNASSPLPLKQQVSATVKSLMSKGMTLSSIQQTVGCTEAELVDMLDSSIPTINCDYFDMLVLLDSSEY